MTVQSVVVTVESQARPTFHDITEDVERAVFESGIAAGVAVVSSPHTTCSVIIQESSHDTTHYGTEFLMQDLVNVLEDVVPTCRAEGQYLHPGPEHIHLAKTKRSEEPWWSLNVDAHLRSALLGRSESIPVDDHKLQLGEFGRIYFADFDQVRARQRGVRIVVMGE